MPRVDGLPELRRATASTCPRSTPGSSTSAELVVLPAESPVPEESCAIATHVVGLIEHGRDAPVRDRRGARTRSLAARCRRAARRLRRPHGDDLRRRHVAAPRRQGDQRGKALYDGVSRSARSPSAAPSSTPGSTATPTCACCRCPLTNEPGLLRRLRSFVSINGAPGRRPPRSGRGRPRRRPSSTRASAARSRSCMGASEAPGWQEPPLPHVHRRRRRRGASRPSCRALGTDTCVTTPRHHVQWVITEHGAADLSALTDVERARALIALAHPDFRDELARAATLGQTPPP